MSPEERYLEVVAAFTDRPRVSREGKGFGSTALKIDGKIFAMLTSRREFSVKLPRDRVDSLVAGGQGHRLDTGGGRQMKEWLAVGPDSELDWKALAEEALAFVRHS